MRTLVLGGIRSGKSAVAERLVTGASLASESSVTYVATGPRSDDADWADRIAAHRARRPPTWHTVESTDLPAAFAELTGPAVVDGLGTWLNAQLDELRVWESPRATWEPAIDARVTALTGSIRSHPHDLVLVSDEVGLTLVPDNRAGRLFADWLGLTNQRVADACDTVHLVIAGQVLTVKSPGA